MLNTGPKRLPDIRPRIGVGCPSDDSVAYFGFSENRAHRFCHVFNYRVVSDVGSPTRNPIAGVVYFVFSEFTRRGGVGLVFFIRRRIPVTTVVGRRSVSAERRQQYDSSRNVHAAFGQRTR